MRNVTRFLWNTILLTATSLLMRLLAMGFQVYLTQRIGPEGIGLFELLMSVYGLAVALAVSGMRLSTTRLVLEVSRRRPEDVVRLCLTYALLMGTAAGVILYACSGLAATLWLDAPELARCLRVLAFSLPCLAVSSCLGGYFSALRQAGRVALVQSLEFSLHAVLTFGALTLFPPAEPKDACLLLVCCSCLSDVFSVALSAIFYRRSSGKPAKPPWFLTGDLLKIAVPDAIGSWVR